MASLEKTKVKVFNKTWAWVTSELGFLIGSEKEAYAQSCTYLGVIFEGSLLFIRRLPMINCLVDIDAFEKQYEQIQYKEPGRKVVIVNRLLTQFI